MAKLKCDESCGHVEPPNCCDSMAADNTEREELEPIYVASRASIPERGEMWRGFRSSGVPITSSWIDEDGNGATADFGDLWLRIADEIRRASALVLYALLEDFPLKGALTEAGIALGMGKPVIVCLPDAGVLPRNYRPIGSWIAHPLVTRCDDTNAAVRLATRSRAAVAAPRRDAADDYRPPVVHLGNMPIEEEDRYTRGELKRRFAISERLRNGADSSPVAPSLIAEQEIDFSCRVCGVQCAVAPDPPARAVCPEHCEDHDYEYMRGEGGHFCKHCGQQAPEDWYDD